MPDCTNDTDRSESDGQDDDHDYPLVMRFEPGALLVLELEKQTEITDQLAESV